MKHTRTYFLLTCYMVLNSCQLQQPYQPPTIDVNSDWKMQDLPAQQLICNDYDFWWEILSDPILNHLEQQVLQSNYSLQAAMENIQQSRALTQGNVGSQWPNVFLAPSYYKFGALINDGGESKSYRLVDSAYSIPLQFNYEFDLFGRVKSICSASYYREEAAEEAYRQLCLFLTASVASNYFTMRGLDLQLVILEKNIRIRQEALEVNQCRYNGGFINYADVTRAQDELAKAQAEHLEIQRQRKLQEGVLAVLAGIPAQEFDLPFLPLMGAPPQVLPLLPCELLRRRPDVIEAERKLAAAHADIGVALADFFPSINLSAQVGFEAPQLRSLFEWKSRLWEFGIDILQTVFDGGSNQANLNYYQSKYQESLDEYHEVVLNAFNDVQDSLINLEYYSQKEQVYSVATEASKETLSLSQTLYNKGFVNYLDVVDAERSVLSNELNNSETLLQRYLSTILLIRALGGTWESH
jgi:outer membrane protein, multidrug efflux system